MAPIKLVKMALIAYNPTPLTWTGEESLEFGYAISAIFTNITSKIH